MNHTLQNPKSGRFSFRKLIVDVILTVFGILMILPLIMLTANAFKTPAELLHGRRGSYRNRQRWIISPPSSPKRRF